MDAYREAQAEIRITEREREIIREDRRREYGE